MYLRDCDNFSLLFITLRFRTDLSGQGQNAGGRCSQMSNVSGMAAQMERTKLSSQPSPRMSQLPPLKSPSASYRSERMAKSV